MKNQIDHEELRDEVAWGCEGAGFDDISGGARKTIVAYEMALQAYLKDKVVLPLEMIGPAQRQFGLHKDSTGFSCFLNYDKENCLAPNPICDLCALLTEAARGIVHDTGKE